MKKGLEKVKPEEFEELGKETMLTSYDIEQAVKTCTPTLRGYELAIRTKLEALRPELAEIRAQALALHSVLYDRPVPVSDAEMLAHSRKIRIVAFLAVLTAIACIVGNTAMFYLMGFGPVIPFLGAIGMTALPLGLGHMAYEWIIGTSRWMKMLIVLTAVAIAATGVVIVGHARQELIDRSITTPTVNSYVDGADADNTPNAPETKPAEGSESNIRRTLGEGMFLFMLAAELGLLFLVGWLIELYGDGDNTAWRQLQRLGRESLDVHARMAQLTSAPEIAKNCCLAGILKAANGRPRRHPPYHQALTLILIVMVPSVLALQAQKIERYDAILIDTSASISRGGRSNELFQEYLRAVKKLLLTEPPNARVWVLSISSDSFGGAQEILKGWTPDARGVFTDDLNRGRLQLASEFERKAAGIAPLASATDIFGALWRITVLFDSGAGRDSTTSASKSIFIFSDMVNETKAFHMPELIELGPERMLQRARSEELLVPLKDYKINIYGASTAGRNPRAWTTIKGFWTRYFAASGADLASYSAESGVMP